MSIYRWAKLDDQSGPDRSIELINHPATASPLRLPTLLSAFFLRYLAVERGVSPHTTTSYRDAMKLLLQFAAEQCRRSVDQLVIEDLTAPVVLEFLADLETSRGNTIRTRNSRLAAVHTFFRYVAGREPALAAICGPVLAIPAKKAFRPLLTGLSQRAGTWSSAGSKSTVWLSAENAITCSSAYFTTPEPVSKNCLI